MEIVFWMSCAVVVYSYLGYPLLLLFMGGIFRRANRATVNDHKPSISVILPVYNEEKVIEAKLENMLSLDYPKDKLEVLVISDGSTDRTLEIAQRYAGSNVRCFEVEQRGGKAGALNLGLAKANNEIIVFSDASIMLDMNALKNIVSRFQDTEIGCVSGEDHILESGGEGAYGRYELYLRNQESRIHSIVGASGSFYAQRKVLCEPFQNGLAPDFLSVLNTVEKGYRAVTEPAAFGTMTCLKGSRDEFDRKVRTLLRGMTTLFFKRSLLNPFRFGFFSIELLSHKVLRWLVPFFLIAIFSSNMFLIGKAFYAITFSAQVLFYMLACIALTGTMRVDEKIWGKIPLYFTVVNSAILLAWAKYLAGVRQEIWNPSQRGHQQ